MDLLSLINNQPYLYKGNQINIETIRYYEEEMRLSFSEDYKIYLCTFGFVTFEGHELTGICDIERLNVLSVTIEEKALNNNIPDNYYVIEQTHYDAIVIWQDQTGAVYQTAGDSEPVKIYDSLSDYIRFGWYNTNPCYINNHITQCNMDSIDLPERRSYYAKKMT